MAKNKIRKQLRLGDIYRYLFTGELPEIAHIKELYFVGNNIEINYDDFVRFSYNCNGRNGTFDEKALREAVKQINKYITEVH